MDIEASRTESLQRLMKEESRSAYKPSFKEKLINHFPFPKSRLYIWLLRTCGMNIGTGVRIMGRIKVKIRGKFENIDIGNDVVLSKNVDLRNRENGRIIIKDKVYLDSEVRIVAAREGCVTIDYGTELGHGTIINSGGNTRIGKYVLCAALVNINSSSHGISKDRFIKDQPHEHGNVEIGDDVWIGSYAAVLMNARVGNGAILGSHSVIKDEIPDFGIAVGVPAKTIKYRT